MTTPVWDELRLALRLEDEEKIEAIGQSLKEMDLPEPMKSALEAAVLTGQGESTKARKTLIATSKTRKLSPEERLVLATIFFEDGKLQMAKKEFSAVLEAGLEDSRIHTGLGLLVLDEHPDQAKEHFAQAVSVEPDNWHARYLMGYAASALGQEGEAFEIFDRVIEEAPGFQPAWLGYAAQAIATGHAPEALDRVAPLAAEHTHDDELLMAHADLLRSVGRVAEAVQTLVPVADRSKDPAFLLSFAELCLMAGQAGAAKVTLEAVGQLGYRSPGSCVLHGMVEERVEGGHVNEAVRWYREALSIDDSHPPALIQLGLLLSKDTTVQDYAAAAELLEKAAQGDAPPIAALLNLAILYNQVGKKDQARSTAQRVLDRQPANPAIVEQAERLIADNAS